ncbi:methyl-accepting chemotaxis protein [Stigmatella hybrida]|uniref:methyl-accepting chemotaxis protein n=1 Tax=Stigmatella hybrida TaxID=394097 RepID=UPI001CDB46BB|nr:methyl-accepting chemotaxis protein [Stigmatella hybrida]
MRRKWTVGQQIAGGYAAVLVSIGILAILTMRGNQRFLETSRTMGHTYKVMAHLETVVSELNHVESAKRGYVITGQDAFLATVRTAEARIAGELETLRALTVNLPEQQRHLASVQQRVTVRLQEMQEVIDARRAKGFEAALALIAADENRRASDTLRSSVDEMRATEERLLQNQERGAEEDARFLTWLAEGGVAAVLIFIVVTGVAISRGLRKQIGQAVEHVQSSSAELQAAATQQVSGAREQASATTEVSTTVKELLSTFRQIAGNAQQVSRVASETAGTTRLGAQTVDRAQEAIETVRRQVDVIVNHMLELGKRSQEIGGILDIINELAEQTNILAINATIESAGAGEHGRRFAVVAEEIRKLADRVGASTKDVRSLIDEVRAAANTTLMATEDGSKAVQNSARQFSDVAGTFKRIAELTGNNLDVAREIELSTQQQTTAVEQVSTAIQQVAMTARQTEVSSAQTLQTSTQLTRLSKQLASLVDSRTSAPA